MQEISLRFIISKGTETIGVKADGAFSADNFTITPDRGRRRGSRLDIVSLAIRDATERVNEMGSPYSDGWDLSKYQEMLDNLSIEGDGMKEFNEIYSLLREKFSASRSRTGGADYTHAIINPDFEFGNTLGWSTILEGEMGVKNSRIQPMPPPRQTGITLFNTWRDGKRSPDKPDNSGTPLGSLSPCGDARIGSGSTRLDSGKRQKKRANSWSVPQTSVPIISWNSMWQKIPGGHNHHKRRRYYAIKVRRHCGTWYKSRQFPPVPSR